MTTQSFYDIGLSTDFSNYLLSLGLTTPTPVQEKAIPNILMGRDIIAIAQTGSGKTAAFVAPMFEILASKKAKARMPRALIVVPTRELASQIHDFIEICTKHHAMQATMLIGGVGMDQQTQQLLKGSDIIVATPGRLLDHIKKGSILLHKIEYLVIDEGDRMLDMGFIPDIEYILSLLPVSKQTLLFSATIAPEIKRLAGKFMPNAKEIIVTPPATTASTIAQFVVKCSFMEKRRILRTLLEDEQIEDAIIFCNHKKVVNELEQSLKRHNYGAAALHGDLNQHQRLDILKRFREKNIKLLVCSDIAARGLDIPHVAYVINFDIPHASEDYVHRIGRTGRAGKKGTAFNLCTPKDEKSWHNIEELIGQEISVYTVQNAQNNTGDAPKKTHKAPQHNKVARHNKAPQHDKEPQHHQREEQHTMLDHIPDFLQKPATTS